MKGRADSPSVPHSLGDHEDRIRKLEFATTVRGDGLRYDFDNEGDWFFGAANDASGSPGVGYVDGQGVEYALGFSWQFDTGDSGAPFAITGDGGFVLDTAGDAHITAGGGLDVLTSQFRLTGNNLEFNSVSGGEDHYLTDTGEEFRIHDDLGTTIFSVHQNGTTFHQLRTTTRTFKVKDAAGASLLQVRQDGYTDIYLRAGTVFTVRDSSGNPKIQWTEGTNDLHIPTGGTVVADL